jgi:hypothetical protein
VCVLLSPYTTYHTHVEILMCLLKILDHNSQPGVKVQILVFFRLLILYTFRKISLFLLFFHTVHMCFASMRFIFANVNVFIFMFFSRTFKCTNSNSRSKFLLLSNLNSLFRLLSFSLHFRTGHNMGEGSEFDEWEAKTYAGLISGDLKVKNGEVQVPFL